MSQQGPQDHQVLSPPITFQSIILYLPQNEKTSETIEFVFLKMNAKISSSCTALDLV